MSKKNLSGTAIEGGRSGYSKNERRESSRHERANMHTLIAGAHGDPEAFDDVVLPQRKKAYKDFADKLNPVQRWMDDRVGKSWNKTYSLLKKKFDSRTTAGRHIVYDHMLRDVWTSPDRTSEFAQYHRYYVDIRGIMRKMPSWRQENEELAQKLRAEKIQIEKWLDRRMIGKIGNVLYWYNPTVRYNNYKYDWYSGRYNTPGYGVTGVNSATSAFIYPLEVRFLRGDRLTGKDIEFFTKLMPNHKDTLLKHAKILAACNCIHAVHHHHDNGECRITGCKCEVKWI